MGLAEVLSFGGRTLHASPRQVLGFTDFSFSQNVKTDSESVDKKEQVTEEMVSTGKISLAVPLLTAFGVDPLGEFGAWRRMLEDGVKDRLYVAGQPINEQVWMLKEVAMDGLMVNVRGVAYEATMRVTFEGQVPPEEVAKKAGGGGNGGGNGGGGDPVDETTNKVLTMSTNGWVRGTDLWADSAEEQWRLSWSARLNQIRTDKSAPATPYRPFDPNDVAPGGGINH